MRGAAYLKLDNELKDRQRRTISPYGTPPLETYQYATFLIAITGMNTYASLDLYTRIVPGEINVKTQKLTFTNQYGERVVTDRFEKAFSVESKQVEGRTTYLVEHTDISAYLDNYFLEIIQYLKDAIKVHKNTNARSLSATPRSEDGIADHLRLEKMIKDLTIRKPLSPCISRVLQLLKTEPFGNQPGISQICSTTFAENTRLGVVKRGAPLSDSPGLFALANLFYDTITMGSPNLTIGTIQVDGKPSTMEQYVAFMTNLSKKYALDDTPRTAAEYEKKGLSGIINKRDERDCQGTTGDIPLSSDTTKKVQEIIKTMFNEQVKHAAKCSEIINMLFKFTYSTSKSDDKKEEKTDDKKRIILINLSDGLVFKGFPELQRINHLTREYLAGYHSNCENKYEEAVKYIVDDQKAKKDTAEAAKTLQKAQQDAALAKTIQEQDRIKAEQAKVRNAATKTRMDALAVQRAKEAQRKKELDTHAQELADKAAAAYQQKKALQTKKPAIGTATSTATSTAPTPDLRMPYVNEHRIFGPRKGAQTSI